MDDVLMSAFVDDFDADRLDPAVWVPHYLPAWSSRAATRASYELGGSFLRLFIPPHQGLWCGDDHRPPIRVSGVQSGNWSGPVGSASGQQPFRDGLLVREEQPTVWGWTPSGGQLEMRARMVLTPRSMAAWWLAGLEDVPERCAEICVVEVFGDALEPGRSAELGMGVKPFRDPRARADFAAPRLPVDVAEFHTYGVDWTRDRAQFTVDGQVVRVVEAPPCYPMQSMLAVFDFPERSVGGDEEAVPELVVDWVRGEIEQQARRL